MRGLKREYKWSEYIKAKAAGVMVHTTEMWGKCDLAHPQYNPTFDHPETYSFVDISQNNHQKGQTHWDNAQRQRARIADNVRPLNGVKIYEADTGRFDNDLFSDRKPNEAYCLANPGTEYAVYFPDGGEVTLNIEAMKKPATVRWLDIMKCQWSSPKRIEGQSKMVLRCPSQDYWAVLIQ